MFFLCENGCIMLFYLTLTVFWFLAFQNKLNVALLAGIGTKMGTKKLLHH